MPLTSEIRLISIDDHVHEPRDTWTHLTEFTSMAQAQELIDEYVAEVNGGAPLDLTLTYNASQQNDGEYLQTVFTSLLDNVNVQVELLQTPEILQRVYNDKDFQFAIVAILFGTDPDEQIVQHFTGDGPTNLSGIADPRLDELLLEQRSTPDGDERLAAMAEIEEILYEQVPYFYLYENTTGTIVNGDEVHWSAPVENIPRWDQIWIEQ
jgi:peptide/nickel transport system substrate-binding protein